MSGKTRKNKKGKTKKSLKKPGRIARSVNRRSLPKQNLKVITQSSIVPTVTAPAHLTHPVLLSPTRPVFSIEIGSINGETTIGDLIVAFPRTRDVLMKHGLRFDVEQAGYLYMTLSVFSAIHGLTTNSLVQELHTASKEPPPQPSTPAQQLRPITTAATV